MHRLDWQERKLITIGYETLLKEGTNLTAALARSTAYGQSQMTNQQRLEYSDMVYRDVCFAAFQKHRFPLQQLLAAAKRAAIYLPNERDGFSVCIVPAGLMDIDHYTNEENMKYSISGIGGGMNKTIKMPLEKVYVDPRTDLKVMVHHPLPNNQRFGSASPDAGRSGLARVVTIGMFYPKKEGGGPQKRLNLQTGSLVDLDANNYTFQRVDLIMRYVVTKNSALKTVVCSYH